ncbi:MAG TPA: hypothetical protein VK325_03905 [Pseudoxanthomonas sp.]|nr:hypothetical protein [Pseudoxanthomonas sp.]
MWPHDIDRDNLHASRSSDHAIPQSTPKLWVFVLEAQPLPEAPEFMEFGGAYVLCYQMPGLARDPVRHASDFLRGAGWLVTGVQEEPEQRTRDEAPESAHFDQALIDEEAYVFHQWRVEDAAGQTRH